MVETVEAGSPVNNKRGSNSEAAVHQWSGNRENWKRPKGAKSCQQFPPKSCQFKKKKNPHQPLDSLAQLMPA